MNNSVLAVKDLSVSFDGPKVISNLSFEVKEGDFLTVVGPNGSGKTVLIKTLLGLIAPTAGVISWHQGAKFGYLPQGLTQSSIKGLPLAVNEFFGLKKVNKHEASHFLKLVGLKESALKQKFGELSGGQFQRVLMAWVLSSHPNVLLLDEPTTGIDAGGEGTIYDLLGKLQESDGLTILMVSHDLEMVNRYSKHVLCLSRNHNGYGRPHEVLTDDNLQKLYGSKMKAFRHRR